MNNNNNNNNKIENKKWLKSRDERSNSSQMKEVNWMNKK